MGNNLCATWQKGYRDGCSWPPRKDAHLIRLWAEIFEVREENNEILWGRVSDDVVPVNVVCIQDSPETVYQITAYNRLVEKIFDVYLTQPGTRIIQASDCFVHWRDVKCDREWGLNFTVPLDARRFRECCMSHICHGLVRKALSSESVKVAHTKKNPNVKVGSNQTSPMSTSRSANVTRQDHNDVITASAKHVMVPTHLHHPSADLQQQQLQQQQQHCQGLPTTALHAAQQLQVRQVLSVYVDNRCRCGNDRHHLLQQTTGAFDGAPQQQQQQQHRPQSFPTGHGVYGPCPDLGTSLYATAAAAAAAPSSHVEAAENQCCHCLAQLQAAGHQACVYSRSYGRHCHVTDDNAINQTIYMSAKEARMQAQQQQQLLYAKNQSLMLLAAAAATGGRDPSSAKEVAPTTEGSQGRPDNHSHPHPHPKAQSQSSQPQGQEVKVDQGREHGSAAASTTQHRQGLDVPSSWTTGQSPGSSPSAIDGSELPASFDSVTLKRMLRSLSGSPPLDKSTGSESKSRSSRQQQSQPICQQNQTGCHQNQPNAQSISNHISSQQDTNKKDVAFPLTTTTVDRKTSSASDVVQQERDETQRPSKAPPQSSSALQEPPRLNGCSAEPGKHPETNGESGDSATLEVAPQRAKREPVVSDGVNSLEHSSNQEPLTRSETEQKQTSGDMAPATLDGSNSTAYPAGHHQRMDSGGWNDTPEVRRLTMSDLSGSECGSDGEGASSECCSIYTVPMQVAFISPSMATRKTGWLMVKNWLVHRKRSVELAAKRTWNKYWVCLKGNVLLFHVCDDGVEVRDDSAPKYRLVLEGALAQSVPEHPKKENIFSLSTAFGDAYLLQASDQAELVGWINALHTACSASFFRQHGRDNILRLLQNEIHRMESSIDLDLKMKKMATMHLTTVTDPQSRHAIDKQITQWEENLEKLYVEHFRLRCYVSSMRNTETPNPKTLLGYVSKNSKVVLGRVGVFTVNAFHALVCARVPLSVSSSVPSSQKARCLLSTFKSDTLAQNRAKTSRGIGLRPMVKLPGGDGPNAHPVMNHCGSPPSSTISPSAKCFVRVRIAGSQLILTVEVNDRTTVQDLMEFVCRKQELNLTDHFLQLKLPNSNSIKIPDKTVQLCTEEYDLIELCTKLLFQIELTRNAKDRDFGFKVAAELANDLELPDSLCIFINEITRCGMAYRKGLVVGDEILVINGQAATQLDMVFVENLLQDVRRVCLTVRSCRIDGPNNGSAGASTGVPGASTGASASSSVSASVSASAAAAAAAVDHQQQPDQPATTGSLLVTSPSQAHPLGAERLPVDTIAMATNSTEIPDLLRTKKAHVLAPESTDSPTPRTSSSSSQLPPPQQQQHTCRHQCQQQQQMKQQQQQQQPDNANVADYMVASSARPLSNSQRICKVILELIDTERLYVRDLMCLIERYLEPLKQETYLSCDDINQLFGNIQEIVQFQKLFLHSLEEAISSDPNFNVSQEPDKLKQVLVLMSSSFVYYAHHFKLYSSFCASHSKAQKMILSDDNVALQEFLKSRNPKQQHSATLESYLIKPIQRIVKYPLLLKQLYELTDPHSKEHFHLREALHGMEAVAEHINEMQKIYEEYGTIFEELMRYHKQGHSYNKGVDLNVGELQMYGTVNWINAIEELGKLKKSTDLLTLVFIFKSAIVLLAQERQKFKKKPKASAGRPAWGCESSESTRFKLAIPVDQLQVRTVVGDVNDRHGIWEIVHCHNEKEGRPKKVYQFLSSHKARNDFIRTIHHTMHESVRRISVAGLKAQQNRIQQQQSGALHQHSHQNQQQHQSCPGGEMDNAVVSKDANSNVASSTTNQNPDIRNGCAIGGSATSPVRRGADLVPGVDGKAVANCITSPGHRTRQHQRDANAPTTELSPRQANSSK